MGLLELKEKIKLQLDLADERVLRIVSSVFDNYLNEDPSENLMTPQERKAIDEALNQVENKQTTSHDFVMEETKKRYSKYFKDEN
ncbi:hypothetical protein SAMN05443667_101333 [Flavobacterium gillisiae]|uniref:Uncharacterized protein n=1 Tax=Flavobacterium gillisiae TaxID=150146 RepID=A0A1H3X3F7_9FLAO|nr:hypothetical protein [Flavobacterium gillisiae]SDZ93048.1 hypothetical protein SAMN05443667_101333 [Flavobacterium gillisiae]